MLEFAVRVSEVGRVGEVLAQLLDSPLNLLLLVLESLFVAIVPQIVDFLLSLGSPSHLHFLFDEVEQELFVPHFVFVFVHFSFDLRL